MPGAPMPIHPRQPDLVGPLKVRGLEAVTSLASARHSEACADRDLQALGRPEVRLGRDGERSRLDAQANDGVV